MSTAKNQLDAATREKVLAAMKKGEWKRVDRMVAGFPTIRRTLARRESYALIELENPTRSSKHSVGWVKVDHAVRNVTDTERFLKDRRVHGYFRIISIKRRARIVADGTEPIVDLTVPRSKPVYEVELWRGCPTSRKRGAWTRLPFPTDWRKCRGVNWSQWIARLVRWRIGRRPWPICTSMPVKARIA